MKRIQPFTIGTKLSVPSETRCLDYVDIISTVEGLDCCEQSNGPIDDSNSSSVHQEQGSTSSPVEGPLHEFKEDDDRNSASPSGSSRSIRKIAMCTNAERHINCIGVDLNETNRSGFEKNLIQERLREKPGAQLETDQLSKGMKIRNLCCDYRISAFPCDQAENTGHSQRRELNDIENSLIQLTTSLDLMECTEEPGGPPQKNTDVPELGLEMFHRKSPKDHSDKSWLKLRSLLKHYHQDLILALDVSSYYQQADSIIGNINTKRSCVLAGEISKSDKENQEIACQINMLNECASRLSTLHPTLARRVTCKQAEVKENWALLQELLRNPKTDVSSKPPSTLPIDPLTTIPDSQSFSRNEGHCVMGKDVKEEQNRLRGFECSRGLWTHRMWSPVEECSVGSQGSLSESSCSKLDLISQDTRSCISQMAQTTPVSSQECLSPNKQLSESTKSPGVTDCSKARQDSKLEELLSQVEVLWDALQRKYGENSEVEAQNKEQAGFKASQMVSELTLPNESEGEGRSGMLERFLELLDPSGYQRMSQYHTEPLEMLEAAEISLNQLHNQAAYKRFQEHDQSTDELQRLIATLTLRINQHLCRCAELSMDLLDIETDTTVFRDLSCLEELHEQQNDQEDHYNIIEAEVHEMERLATQQQIPPPQRRDPLREEVQAILQAWEEVGRSMAENRVRLSKFQQIREYFEKYLNMITWTENTRSCLLAGSSAWRNSEAAEIDRSIKTKLDEFSKLTAAAQSLMQEESPLKDIIKERTDELQSMLGWIQVNWRSKRHQLERSQNGGDERINNPVQQQVLPFTNPSNNICILNRELKGIASETQLCSSAQHLARHDISSVSHESCLSKTTLGSSICLILSFDEQSTGINQVTTQWSPNNETYEEPKSNIQEENEQSQAKVQQVEICEVTWPTDAVLSNGTKQMTSYGNLEQLQNSYQGEPTQSLNKQIETSLISLGNAESSSLNHSTDKLEPVSEESNLQLFPVIDHADSSQLLTKSKERVQISAYNDYTNQQQCKDHLRHEVSAEVTHRVFTYLHVSDSNRLPGRVLVATSIPLDKDEDMDSPLSQGVTSQEGAVSRQNRSNLKKPMKIKEKVLHRNSTLGTVGMESSGNPSSIFRQRCNTWPEGECRVKARSYSNSKLEIFIRSDTPPVNAVTDDNYTPLPEENLPNVVKTSSGGVKNICSYLSLGSTLSFSLPRRFDNSVLVTENKVECESLQEYIVPIKQGAQTPLFEMKQESVTVTNKADHNLQKVDNLENTSQNKTQQLTHMYIKTEPALMSENYSVIQNKAAPPKAKTSSSSPLDHQCLSVHTKIKDLNGHLYNMSKHMKISSLENSTDTLSSCKRSRIINCGVQDCAVCFSETVKKKPDVIMQELLQPGHWLFQQDEEELEDIWRGKLGNLNYTEETNMDEKTARNRIPTAKV